MDQDHIVETPTKEYSEIIKQGENTYTSEDLDDGFFLEVEDIKERMSKLKLGVKKGKAQLDSYEILVIEELIEIISPYDLQAEIEDRISDCEKYLNSVREFIGQFK